MPVAVICADEIHLPDCLEILLDSILGEYFEPELAQSILKSGCTNHELFVAIDQEEVVGFYLSADKGAFLVFPYLHLLAVKTGVRSHGIGTSLLRHFENQQMERDGYPFNVKSFLLVSQENTKAIGFYEHKGYQRKAVFDDMFSEGDTEILMMKELGSKGS